MEKKYYIQLLICSLVILISIAVFNFYYQTYIAPESFVIGSLKYDDYKSLPIKDYLSDDEVIFSQNINDVTFSNRNGVATYEYNFDAKSFNGIDNDYIIYVNDYLITSIEENAGTISGTYKLNYYDVEKKILCSSSININFSFYSLKSVLKVSLDADDLGYLMKYFETDNFIITLTENPFLMLNKDGEFDEKVQEIVSLTNQVNILTAEITSLNVEIAEYLEEIEVLSKNESENLLEIQNLREQVVNLEQMVTELESQVSYYQQLLDEYKNIDKNIVTFVSDLDVVKVELVNDNKFATEPLSPSKLGFVFVGWSVDGENLVDVTTYSIVEDVTFIAVYSNNPGLYNSITKEIVLSWEDMLNNGYLSVDENNVLSRGSNYKSLQRLVGSLVLDSCVESISSNTFRDCLFSEIILNDGLLSIDSYSFSGSSIRTIAIPDSVIEIKNGAFYRCLLLENVRLSKNLKKLYSAVFNETSISSIVIPYGVDFIGAFCFMDCKLLVDVVIPSSVTHIGVQAFKGCSNLMSIYIPSSVVEMDPDSIATQSIFYECSDIVVYCEVDREQPGWTQYWNNYDTTNKVVVKYGYTYEQYLEEIKI